MEIWRYGDMEGKIEQSMGYIIILEDGNLFDGGNQKVKGFFKITVEKESNEIIIESCNDDLIVTCS